MIRLDFKILMPMYFEKNEDDYEELCERADYFGEDALTEDEQYFIETYHRLDDFYTQLLSDNREELRNAVINNNTEIYIKYANEEASYYLDKTINEQIDKLDRENEDDDEDEFDKLCGFPLDADDY